MKKAERERHWKALADTASAPLDDGRPAGGRCRSEPMAGRAFGLERAGSLRLDACGSEPGPQSNRLPQDWHVHPTVVSILDPRSAVAEQYRAARTWLLRRETAGKHSAVAITSSVPREGKSVTTANLAAVMAEVRHMQVLAVDCDFRQGSLSRLFNLPRSPGLSDVLVGRAALDEAIHPTPLGNLAFLPAGEAGDLNPTELLNSITASRIFDEIRERFHFSLVDTPPVHWLSDIGVIGALCSGIVLVVRMNKTASHLVRQSVHWLQANHLDVLGCIAADCRVRGARYEYTDSEDE
ncbi:MAG: CpsD/CapB family tyrosine-protein kinase [Phycisphaerae bacterium]